MAVISTPTTINAYEIGNVELNVAVYWVGVANQSELNTSPRTQALDFAGEG